MNLIKNKIFLFFFLKLKPKIRWKISIFAQIKFIMKKLLAYAFIGSLVLASCAKKETTTESNVMLEEPEVTVTDTAKAAPAPAAATPVATDSATSK